MDRAAQCALGAGVTTFFHPVAYAKILIQIGYEPLAPVPSTTLFGSKVLYYPSIFKYMGHIRQTDGFFGLYRGLGARLTSGILCNYISNVVQTKVSGRPLGVQEEEGHGGPGEECDEPPPNFQDAALKLMKDSSYETISRCAGIVISHPFQVMFIRSVAQFVGREIKYNSILSSIAEIWEQEGILGFFSGLVPRLAGEVITIWLANLLAHTIRTFILSTDQANVAKGMGGYTVMISQLLVTQFTYPFTLVSNIMCINGSGLTAGRMPFTPVYSDWFDCWSRLKAETQLKRGSSIFWRTYKGPVTYNRAGDLVPAAVTRVK